MREYPDGFIHGNTDAMFTYAPQGPDPAVVGQQQPLTSRLLDGGPALVAADAAATERLTAFITSANTAFEVLGRNARRAGVEYLNAEDAATAAFRDVLGGPGSG